MSDQERTAEERHQARRDELESMLIREAVSLAAMAVVLVLLSPGVQRWVKHQVRRARRWQVRDDARTDRLIADLRAELSRDLPAVEHGLVDP